MSGRSRRARRSPGAAPRALASRALAAGLFMELAPGCGAPAERAPARVEVERSERGSPASALASATGLAQAPSTPPATSSTSAPASPTPLSRVEVEARLSTRAPRAWGTAVSGVRTRARGAVLALTFDLCDGDADHELVELLRRERVPATFFVSGRFSRRHPELVRGLAKAPTFSVENHGEAHKPCSVRGKSAYGIAGTASLSLALREIDAQTTALERLVGRRPSFYRPGTAHLDDVCAEAAALLGTPVVGFSVLGDSGGGLGRRAVRDALVRASDGSIVLLHANKPRGQTFEGVRDALPELRRRGARLVRLVDVALD